MANSSGNGCFIYLGCGSLFVLVILCLFLNDTVFPDFWGQNVDGSQLPTIKDDEYIDTDKLMRNEQSDGLIIFKPIRGTSLSHYAENGAFLNYISNDSSFNYSIEGIIDTVFNAESFRKHLNFYIGQEEKYNLPKELLRYDLIFNEDSVIAGMHTHFFLTTYYANDTMQLFYYFVEAKGHDTRKVATVRVISQDTIYDNFFPSILPSIKFSNK